MLLTSSTIITALEIVIIVEIVANRLSLCIIVDAIMLIDHLSTIIVDNWQFKF
jgi:hypothetical protein